MYTTLPFWTLSLPLTSDPVYMLTSPLSSPTAQPKSHTAHFLLLLSPLATRVLPKALTIPALSRAFYADDITLWVTTGNTGDIESTLQAGVDAVTTHARAIGFSCSPTNSGLLLLLPRGMAPLSPVPLTVSVDGTPLPLVSTLRILGLFLQSNGKHTTLITQLSNMVHETMRLIRHIANRHHGMREHDLRRLVQAFVLRRFVYSLPSPTIITGLFWCPDKTQKIDSSFSRKPVILLLGSESSFSLGVDSSIELSPSLDECDVEMLVPREVKRAHTTGTSSDGTQDSRSESQQPKKPRPSSRGPKCVV
ncbi:hypothetical protein HPB52_004754 [Rhipicephalus sanguineus]|uniref:Tick transposon n=1 Tax=Rhipicephalus sanguineus TaxID=34632 RepID=A0A9D4Q915_RHISA|nr:hypothetical protein HPB52_004754 [Rhipicephalus sanguineus]